MEVFDDVYVTNVSIMVDVVVLTAPQPASARFLVARLYRQQVGDLVSVSGAVGPLDCYVSASYGFISVASIAAIIIGRISCT